MASELRKEIKSRILSDNQLMVDYAEKISCSVLSLPKLFERNSKSLTQHDAVVFLAKRLGKKTEQIVTDTKVTA